MTLVEGLENGLTAVFERGSGPGFALELRVPTGAAHDPSGSEGAAALLEEWLHKGAGGLGARELADAYDELGLRRGGGVTHEATRFTVSGLVPDLGAALKLIADTVRSPHLPEDEFDTIADLARQDLEGLADNPSELLGVKLRARVFAPPFGHAVGGTLDALERVTANDVRRLHASYGPRGSVLVIVANMNAEDALRLVRAHFGAWAGGAATLPRVAYDLGFSEHVTQDAQQTQIGAMFAGVSPTDPDWMAFHLALGVLSGGSASRLFRSVREERGLAYSVGAQAHVVGGAGFAWAFAGTTHDRASETLEVVLSEFERLSKGVTEGEFERARAGLLASLVFAGESSRGRAGMLTRDIVTLGRARHPGEVKDELSRVTRADLHDFLARRPFVRPGVMTLGPAPLTVGGARVPA